MTEEKYLLLAFVINPVIVPFPCNSSEGVVDGTETAFVKTNARVALAPYNASLWWHDVERKKNNSCLWCAC